MDAADKFFWMIKKKSVSGTTEKYVSLPLVSIGYKAAFYFLAAYWNTQEAKMGLKEVICQEALKLAIANHLLLGVEKI